MNDKEFSDLKEGLVVGLVYGLMIVFITQLIALIY